MSRTDKDMPYRVYDTRVDHNHTKGMCNVGSWKEYIAWRTHARTDECSKYTPTDTLTCVHDTLREKLQKRVDIARKSQRSYIFRYWMVHGLYEDNDLDIEFYINRTSSSHALHGMITAGYIPNCPANKTHEVRLEDIDLRLNPYEHANALDFGRSRYTENPPYNQLRYHHKGQPSIFLYDPSIECATCNTPITCIAYSKNDFERRNACWCCEGENHKIADERKYDGKKPIRMALESFKHEYNTFGAIDQY